MNEAILRGAEMIGRGSTEIEGGSRRAGGTKADANQDQEDGWFVAGHPWELAYVTGAMAKEFPRRTLADIEIAIGIARRRVRPSEGKEKLIDSIRQLLKRR